MNSLTNKQIMDYLDDDDIIINGIFSKDELPKNLKNGFYVVNMQNSNDGNGTHWVALYFDNISCYFDSFGFVPPEEIENKAKPYIYNKKDIQSISSSSCGFYCIAFIKYLNKSKDKPKDYLTFINLFNTYDKDENERILQGLL